MALSATKQAQARIAAGRLARERAGQEAIRRVAELEAVLRQIATPVPGVRLTASYLRRMAAEAVPEAKTEPDANAALRVENLPTYSDQAVRLAELEVALRALVDRCDGAEGIQPDGSNMDTCAAHAALGDFKPEGEVVDAELSDEQWAALPVLRVCPHGKTAGECNDCDVAADFAFDAAREDRAFGRR